VTGAERHLPGRVLALDLGTRRIGVALSDATRTIASPYEVLARSGDRTRDHERIRALIEEVEANLLVVGLPLSMDGSTGPAARSALAEVDELAARAGVPVEPYDERLTTVSADRILGARGVRAKDRRAVVDMVAAAVILQSWLDAQPPESAQL
jgi:putative Holliday junction resolvase